ncbi:unnamed protein product, partial [Meganyctiphanes norvegica]
MTKQISKRPYRGSTVLETTDSAPIDASDDTFWEQFWGDHVAGVQDIFALIPAAEIRALREEAPSNLATLCYKAVEKLVQATDTGCSTHQEQEVVLNCVRILTRVIPYIFEDPDWRGFFWSSLPAGGDEGDGDEAIPLAHSLVHALCDLLFCPDFTVAPNKKSGPDKHEDLQSIDSCEYIWESGVGFAHSPPHVPAHDSNRTEILKLILTCFSQSIYSSTSGESSGSPNRWISIFTSADNRHPLPLFTSLLNIVCGYDPVGMGVPYNHMFFADTREPLVEVALQILITTLDHDVTHTWPEAEEVSVPENLFINYLSRIHREEDFFFVLRGFTRLLNNPLQQTYLPHSAKKVNFHQELLVFFWKFCDYNKKFLFYVLKSSDVLDILVPILYHLNDARADQCNDILNILVPILYHLNDVRADQSDESVPYTKYTSVVMAVNGLVVVVMVLVMFERVVCQCGVKVLVMFERVVEMFVTLKSYILRCTIKMIIASHFFYLILGYFTKLWPVFGPHLIPISLYTMMPNDKIFKFKFKSYMKVNINQPDIFNVFAALASLYQSESSDEKNKHFFPNTHPKKGCHKSPLSEGVPPPHPIHDPVRKTALGAQMQLKDTITTRQDTHSTGKTLECRSHNGDINATVTESNMITAAIARSIQDDITSITAMVDGAATAPPCAKAQIPTKITNRALLAAKIQPSLTEGSPLHTEFSPCTHKVAQPLLTEGSLSHLIMQRRSHSGPALRILLHTIFKLFVLELRRNEEICV